MKFSSPAVRRAYTYILCACFFFPRFDLAVNDLSLVERFNEARFIDDSDTAYWPLFIQLDRVIEMFAVIKCLLWHSFYNASLVINSVAQYGWPQFVFYLYVINF